MNRLKHLFMLSAAASLLGVATAGAALAQVNKPVEEQHIDGSFISVGSYQNDTSLPLYYLPAWKGEKGEGREAAENPRIQNKHINSADPVVQHAYSPTSEMPSPILNFDGIPFPGVGCNCAPPDTDGEVGETQYVQMVNEGFQVFDKTTGASVLGPNAISSLWAGFGGVCETGGAGDPIVLYDQIAKRWLISQFAGGSTITDECVAVSTSSDATGTYNRYGFHLGTNFFDYPHLGVWPDGYYMAMNVFNAAGTAFLGPQPFAFDRTAMLAGTPATFVTVATPLGASFNPLLPSDLDGSTLPPFGAPNPFVEYPGQATPVYNVYRFHVDFAVPANSTFALASSPATAAFSTLCTSRACVPEANADFLDGIDDRLMFRLAYRNFGGHESLVGNFTVGVGGTGAIRWFELRSATSGATTVFQEGTYQPDATWRWMGSVAMDTVGDMALGYSASSTTINPQVRYAGRLAGDPVGTLPQAEVHLFDGTGSQSATGNRWGDYSDLTVDPVDDCTFWYTNEYYSTTGTFNWRTRIGSFKFPGCSLAPGFSLNPTPSNVSVCAGTSASYSVAVGSVQSFNSPVTLAAVGTPAPGIPTFTPNPVTPLPGSSSLQITTTGVATGTYPITINGTAVGATSQTAAVGLTVFAAAPGAPTLTAPANASTGQALRPTFTWSGSATESYTIDIATDNAFASIVLTQTVTGTTFTPAADFAANTTFFWRVTPTNACGVGVVSSTFSFTTANLICRSPALAIPDNVPAGVNDVLTVTDPSGATLTNLQLTIKTTHTWVGDLKYTLSRTVGSTIVIDRPGVPAISSVGCSSDNIDVTIDDTAATLVENQCNATPPALSGLVKPNNALAAPFNGQTLAGNWTLNVSDNAGGDIGTLDQWCLVPTTTGGVTYTVGGNVSGLTGAGLVLSLNSGAQTLPVAASGPFTFPTGLADGSPYTVTVGTPPSGQACTVTNGSGTIAAANVTNVAVACSAVTSYTLTYTAGPNGSISGTTPQTVSPGGNGTAVTAVPNSGYHFVQWNDASTQNPRTDTNVNADVNVTASFAINTYTLTYTAGPNGSISGTSPQTVSSGGSGTAVTAVPALGYHFVQWSDASTANPRTDTNVTADISVTASFAFTPVPATQLVFVQQPTNGAAGVALSPAVTVEARDALGNVVVTDSNNVTLTVNGPGPFAPASTQTVALSSGVATFSNLIFNVVGTGYTLTAHDAAESLTSAPSSAFNIVAGPATQIVFTTQPANVLRGNTLGTVAVTEEDALGNVVLADSSSSVDFTIAACGGPVDLGSVTLSSGVGTLSSSSQHFYTLASGLTVGAVSGSFTANSNSFNVVAAPGYIFSDGFDGCRL